MIGLIASDTKIADPTVADDEAIIDAYLLHRVPREKSQQAIARMRALVAQHERAPDESVSARDDRAVEPATLEP